MTEPLSASRQSPRLAPAAGWSLTLLSWLIPGAGFLVLRQYARAAALFLLIETPFVIGVLLTGSVLLPAWTPGDWGFNIVNSLTFITQMGNGLLGGVWLIGGRMGAEFFQGQEWGALFDLASFHIMVSGAMNYFAVCNFYDRHVAERQEQ